MIHPPLPSPSPRRAALAALVVLLLFPLSAATNGPLRVSKDNPRYFMDAAGRTIFVAGGHPGDRQGDFERLQAAGHNFTRKWVSEGLLHDPEAGEPGRAHEPIWPRTGPGVAVDGQPKFDLTKFNPAHFQQLRQNCDEARARGVYVDVMLFYGWSQASSTVKNAYRHHPFHPDNNINLTMDQFDPRRTGKPEVVHTLASPEMTALRELYVRRVLDTLADLDNVVYEIGNEFAVPSKRRGLDKLDTTPWQYHMIRYVKEYERTKPVRHLVGMTSPFFIDDNAIMLNSPADWYSPGSVPGDITVDQDYTDDPPIADGRKVSVADTDHIATGGATLDWLWKMFTRGHNIIVLSALSERPPKPNSDRDAAVVRMFAQARSTLGHLVKFSERLDLAHTVPALTISTTRYALVNLGRQYLVYQPSPGSAFVVTCPNGLYTCEWFNPESGEAVAKEEVTARSRRAMLAPPFRYVPAVALLERKAESGAVARADAIPKAGLVFWISADQVERAGGTVAAIKDGSGRGNHAVRSRETGMDPANPTIATRPSGGHAVLRFSGQNCCFTLTQPLTDVRTGFVVVSKDAATFGQKDERCVLGARDSHDLHTGWTNDTIYNSLVNRGHLSRQAADGRQWLNGRTIDAQKTPWPKKLAVFSFTTAGPVRVDQIARDRSMAGRAWQGEIGEILLYNTVLSDADRTTVERYLQAKYGIEPELSSSAENK